LDALTHFFVARDSMYRQVYQHRVLQAVDAMTVNIIRRLRDLIAEHPERSPQATCQAYSIFCDESMAIALASANYVAESLDVIFQMTESWWRYHLNRWASCEDPVLSDLAARLRDRRLLKTIRVEEGQERNREAQLATLLERATAAAEEFGFDPRYYVVVIEEKDKHRGKHEDAPMALLDDGTVLPVTAVEPMIDQIMKRSPLSRTWLAVPKRVKEKLGRLR
ncbi:MAG: hypothetical protein KDD69_11640, partial [Bdellovibrionales bacterium]|nr:hypothetical protein [Bdellovibrionales bacterium]